MGLCHGYAHAEFTWALKKWACKGGLCHGYAHAEFTWALSRSLSWFLASSSCSSRSLSSLASSGMPAHMQTRAYTPKEGHASAAQPQLAEQLDARTVIQCSTGRLMCAVCLLLAATLTCSYLCI